MKRKVTGNATITLAITFLAWLPALALAASGGPGPQPGQVRAHRLIGADVVNLRGEPVGKVEELVLDTLGARLADAVVAFDGHLDVDGQHTLVPWGSFALRNADAGGPLLLLEATTDQLAGAISFADDTWPEFGDARLSRWPGRKALDRGLHPVGTVMDVIVDPLAGAPTYVLITVDDDYWDRKAKQIAVPWERVTVKGPQIILDADARLLATLTVSDKDLQALDARSRSGGHSPQP